MNGTTFEQILQKFLDDLHSHYNFGDSDPIEKMVVNSKLFNNIKEELYRKNPHLMYNNFTDDRSINLILGLDKVKIVKDPSLEIAVLKQTIENANQRLKELESEN